MDLESLTNKELRAKCMQFGLPDVPVTDSSRKLLIRRLLKAMSPSNSPVKKANKRRETIVATPTAPKTRTTASLALARRSEESNKIANVITTKQSGNNGERNTLPGPIYMETDEAEEDAEVLITPANKINNKKISPLGQSQTAVTISGFPECFYDNAELPSPIQGPLVNSTFMTEPPRQQQQPPQQKQYFQYNICEIPMEFGQRLQGQNRMYPDLSAALQQNEHDQGKVYRRSPSLSKSEVLTTSYRQEVSPVIKTLIDHYKEQVDVAEEEPMEVQEDNDGHVIDAQRHVYNNNYRSSMSSAPEEFRTSTANSPNLYRCSRSYLSSGPIRSYTTSIPSTNTASLYGPRQLQLGRQASSPTENEETEEQDWETPFLSSFTRRLESLKAGIEKSANVKGIKQRSTSSDGRYGVSQYHPSGLACKPRRTFGVGASRDGLRHYYEEEDEEDYLVSDGADSSLTQLWHTLDQKYRIKRMLIILLILIVIAFLYVLLYT